MFKIIGLILFVINLSASEYDKEVRISCNILINDYKNESLLNRMGKSFRDGFNKNSKYLRIDPIVDNYLISLYQADACKTYQYSLHEYNIADKVMQLMLKDMIKDGLIIKK